MNVHDINYFVKSHLPEFLYPAIIQYRYKKRMGIFCNLKNPQTYTEKMQWAKLNRRDQIITELTDKIKVRDWIKNKIGEEYLIPMIAGPFDSPDEIDFDSLPETYVIKTNHGSGTNIIVTDKNSISKEDIKNKIRKFLGKNFAYHTMELQYKEIKPRIYIEKFMIPEGEEDLPDYKFFCFDGKVFCSYTMIDYTVNHSEGRLGFFDRDYKLMPYYRADYKPIKEQLPPPDKYWEMVELAETLSKGFSHVRVDFYNVEGKVYFGEMTFTNASGLCIFVPDEFDRILGDQWDLGSGI
ncbi:ATP-grasp fold amidoligase family protein [Butyrivibrio sp. MB2005]|uniref:ATP-grasp fold amidoligase family protein n=1 Tax=Butyrivibrio sp. MB2005 TaxID=1280678 RepID=UPI0004264169|nr:ATP-grasp fold amidoligase family protein [Butyrivibrio sp. MB2005]